MPELFDSHFHLYPEDNLGEILRNARKANVDWLTVVAVDLASSQKLPHQIADQADKKLLTTVGIHPHAATQHDEADLEQLRQLATLEPVKAIGEIGLDYHYDFSPPKPQKELFGKLLKLAAELAMPAIVHCREAYQDCFDLIRESKVADNSRILLHSYTGSPEWVRKFSREFDAWFSFNGIVTFKQADNVRESLLAVPNHRLLLETDAPYLAPVPFRGRRNQPAWLPHIAQYVAGQKKMEVEKLAELTTANARQFFAV